MIVYIYIFLAFIYAVSPTSTFLSSLFFISSNKVLFVDIENVLFAVHWKGKVEKCVWFQEIDFFLTYGCMSWISNTVSFLIFIIFLAISSEKKMATFHILKCITVVLLNRGFAKHLFHEQKRPEVKPSMRVSVGGGRRGGRKVCKNGSSIPGLSCSSLCPSRDPELLYRHVFVQLWEKAVETIQRKH